MKEKILKYKLIQKLKTLYVEDKYHPFQLESTDVILDFKLTSKLDSNRRYRCAFLIRDCKRNKIEWVRQEFDYLKYQNDSPTIEFIMKHFIY